MVKNRSHNRTWILVVIIILVIAIAAGIIVHYRFSQNESKKYSGPLNKITIGVYKGEDSFLPYVAKRQGFFIDNGLDATIKEYAAGKFALRDLLDKKLDIATCSETAFMFKSFDNDNIRILGIISEPNIIKLVARSDHGIVTVSDLKGKRIGFKRGTGTEFFLWTFLMYNGLSMQDIEAVNVKPAEVMDTIMSGDIDAAMTWEPNIYHLKKQLGENIITWPGQAKEAHYFIIISTKETIETKPEVIKRVMKAIVEAEEFVNQNEAKAKKMAEQIFKHTPAYVDYIWTNYHFTVGLFQALLLVLEDQARWAIEHDLTDKTKVPNYLNYIYMDALEEVDPKAVTIIH